MFSRPESRRPSIHGRTRASSSSAATFVDNLEPQLGSNEDKDEAHARLSCDSVYRDYYPDELSPPTGSCVEAGEDQGQASTQPVHVRRKSSRNPWRWPRSQLPSSPSSSLTTKTYNNVMSRPAFPSPPPDSKQGYTPPSILKSSMGSSSADCRTRSLILAKKRTRFGSASTTMTNSSQVTGEPACIFEHYRGNPTDNVNEPMNRKSFQWSPSSFGEIEGWLQAQIDEALAAAKAPTDPGDQSSAMKIIFINEKRCERAWREEVCDVVLKLHPKLKIHDWTTAHYMTTFCRFPVPLDVDTDALPGGHSWDYRYSISHPFDWDMVWAYLPSTRTTVAILRTWFDNYGAGFQEMEETVDTFSGPTLAHPMLMGIFALQLLTNDAMSNVREKGNRIYDAQTNTGFHVYTHLRMTDGDESDNVSALNKETAELGITTREVLGAASNLTGWEPATEQLSRFCDFVLGQSREFAISSIAAPQQRHSREFRRLCGYIEQSAEKLRSDLDGAHRDAQAWLSTAQFLMQGVLNLVSQRDAAMNIKLATNSNKIAEEAKRDSTSMMAIAVVTMFFLPGTFTSSFFAMPYFEGHMSDLTHFWLYWAVTVPLTVMTMLIWMCWIWANKPTGLRRFAPRPMIPRLNLGIWDSKRDKEKVLFPDA